ncbi:hypothetical protein LN042_18755 [Kitasatospora sp. RB6PN24]|uniref:hypothetical protein n=1 Tax=Kitasatospora humi TaxID=2893891 RepID=UPI001E50E45D|nr:hypothetical protein [Kitasatospora humi]MCC9309097.1 hypothetical protein [Kitasatospora humi]
MPEQQAPNLITRIQLARDRHHAAANDSTLGPSARRYHQHAACGYTWALGDLTSDEPAAQRHLGYAAAYAELAKQHAVSSRRWTLTLPGAFCDWFTTTDLYRNGYTGTEADDRLLLAYHAGTSHRIGASGWTLTIPAHDPHAMLRLTEIAKDFINLADTIGHAPSQSRAARALTERIEDLAHRQSAADY